VPRIIEGALEVGAKVLFFRDVYSGGSEVVPPPRRVQVHLEPRCPLFSTSKFSGEVQDLLLFFLLYFT